MAAVPNITPSLVLKLKKKAIAGRLKFRIAAIAFSRKGNVLGMEVNSCNSRRVSYEEYSKRCITKESCKFSGKHAERALMEKYGKRIASILILRVGHGGDLRAIQPCDMCKKIADKLGIRIFSVDPESWSFHCKLLLIWWSHQLTTTTTNYYNN